MWDIPRNDTTIRPWFYSWSVLARFVRPGSTIYRPDVKADELRVLAAQIGHGADQNWTVVLVNVGKSELEATVRAPLSARRAFSEYLYAQDSVPTDNTGVFKPASRIDGSLAAGIAVGVPAHSMVVLTSF
jgi:hypothetical protein